MRQAYFLSASALGALLFASLFAPPAHAERKAELHPYLGLDQTVVGDLSGGGNRETLTYTSAIVGLNARIHNRTTEVQANLAYQHQFTWSGNSGDSDVVSGLVQARTTLARGLQLEGGALATRVRTDGFTGANGSLAGPGSRSQVYSAYAGPTYAGQIGDVTVNAAYRLGYNRVESGFDTALAGSPLLDSFDDSITHSLTASVGVQPGVLLPIGIAASVGYAREDASQLDQRYDDKWGRVDVTVPLTPDLAAIGGVCYQAIEISNRDALRDTAGTPIRDGNGRFITDSASPRLLSYDNDEVIWDVGVLWRPSRRTSLSLTYGHRYGSESVRGSFSWQPDRNSSVNISIFDSIDSFGRALNGNLANLPQNFTVNRNPFSGDISGCAFGMGGASCFSDSLSGIRTANYRNRGIVGSYSRRAGPWNYGIGLGYSRRKFVGDDPVFAGVSGVREENYFAAGQLGYAIDERSGINANLYANKFESGIAGVADVFNAGAYLNYYRLISRRLQANASVGLDHAERSGVDSVLSGLAQIGIRYQF
ncbi:hypothetical protein BH10PSE13_BH10PSE13_02090 [soil metagenome]